LKTNQLLCILQKAPTANSTSSDSDGIQISESSRTATNTNSQEVVCTKQYTIKQGDTCKTISDTSRVTLTYLLKSNPTLECFKPLPPPGSTLCIESNLSGNFTDPTIQRMPPPQPVPECLRRVIIKQGDTCNRTATENGLSSVGALYSLNKDLFCGQLGLNVGRELCVESARIRGRPTGTATAANPSATGESGAQPSPEPEPEPEQPQQPYIAQLHNRHRGNHGLGGLAYDYGLEAYSYERALYLSSIGCQLDHHNPDGSKLLLLTHF
jgi:LysM repeat protein